MTGNGFPCKDAPEPTSTPAMTDWKAIVSDLFEAMGRAELAEAVEAGVSTLADLANGKTTEPRHGLGVRLLALHKRYCKKAA